MGSAQAGVFRGPQLLLQLMDIDTRKQDGISGLEQVAIIQISEFQISSIPKWSVDLICMVEKRASQNLLQSLPPPPCLPALLWALSLWQWWWLIGGVSAKFRGQNESSFAYCRSGGCWRLSSYQLVVWLWSSQFVRSNFPLLLDGLMIHGKGAHEMREVFSCKEKGP